MLIPTEPHTHSYINIKSAPDGNILGHAQHTPTHVHVFTTKHGHNFKSGCKINKSPRGLNAHLNWRKLPVVHLGVCHQLEKLWGPSPGPPWGHVYHLNNSESPTPKDVFWIRWHSYFLGPLPNPLSPPPPGGAYWGHPGNCHEQL